MDRDTRRGTTKAFLRDGRTSGMSTIVACVGDSITEGVGSADWVAMLRERVGPKGVQVVNAGVAGDLSWNALQRLDAVVQCDPDVVTLMIGTNDVAAESFSWLPRLLLRLKGIDRIPTLEWYVANVSAILRRLQDETHARIAVIDIPIMGEDIHSETNERINQFNEALYAIAAEHGVPCLPLHDRLVSLLPAGHNPPPYRAKVWPVMKAQVLHLVFHRSWQEVSDRNGLALLVDHTHLGERAGEVVAELVAEIVTAS